MAVTILWTPIERLLFSFYIFLAITGGIKYILNAKSSENKNQKNILLGFAALGLINGIAYTFWFLAHFYYPGVYIAGTYMGEVNDNFSPAHEILFFGHFFFDLMFIIYIFQYERVFPSTKFILTFLMIFFSFLHLISFWFTPINWNIFYFSSFFIMAIVFLTIFRLVLKSSIEYQNLSFFIFIGFIIYASSTFFDIPDVKQTSLFPIELGIILKIIGMSLVLLPAFIDVENIIKVNPNRIFGIFFFIISLTFIIVIYSLFLIGVVAIILLLLISFTLIIGIYKYKLSKRIVEKSSVGDLSQPEILTAFIRPKRVTEEEVTISKEKKICLVCKGKVQRFNSFICDCGALYCQKCAQALSEIENACWVCEAPLDETKPVRLDSKEDDNFRLEPEVNKKYKKELDH